ncbi:hypothetical protein HCQ94_03805 [Actinomyces sp. zg-332]|uniref:hypothetical protein n=1 Tax=Actinomyces sp. zg-332 TaxID=2708340 RepID=UPI0018C2FC64|nr:hypothetical protein [Actinomyces sp. zg-332]QPK93728.1 hypothetical protein HCQ94_03805 [Actinomyces sp. zg-332]
MEVFLIHTLEENPINVSAISTLASVKFEIERSAEKSIRILESFYDKYKLQMTNT